MPSQIGYFDTLKNAVGKIFTFSKTITLTSPDDTSVITLPSGTKTVPATTQVIGGDGTAGRILRRVSVLIRDGTDANTLKCTMSSLWNGDAIPAEDNIPKGGATASFSLNAAGTVLTILDAAISGDNVVVLAGEVRYNESGTAVNLDATSGGISIILRHTTTGVAQDMTALVDIGDVYLYITYLTTA